LDDEDEIPAAAKRLRAIVGQITPEEFRWQEANYDRDSLAGRELLFLIANNEWARATSEMIDLTRSDAVDTTVKIDIDLDRVTYEAFQRRTGRLWLPVLLLPPPSGAQRPQRLPEPDPFVTLTVTDASGVLLAALPNSDVQHRISAALAEIIVNMAVARWLDSGHGLTATRDQRLMLSAAIYRLLRREDPGQQAYRDAATRHGIAEALPRISTARRELYRMLDAYIEMIKQPDADPGHDEGGSPAPGLLARRLAWRAVQVLRAFAESSVVVVAVEREFTPTVVTVQVPSRRLRRAPRQPLGLAILRNWRQASAWHGLWQRVRPSSWNWVLPRAYLQVDLLLPSADADRQVQVNLPEGLSFDPSQAAAERAEMQIQVTRLTPVDHLARLVDQLLAAPEDWPTNLAECLADLATVKADAARESLRDHRVKPPDGAAAGARLATAEIQDKLGALRAALDQFCAEGDQPQSRVRLRDAWQDGAWLRVPMQRRASMDRLSPGAVVTRVGMIEDVSKRAAPADAKVHIHVAVTDAEHFSIATFTSRMNALLIGVVIFFFLLGKFLGISQGQVSAEVLAFVLTLFSAIQATRIERPDRSTLRGLLSLAGNGLIVTSILPTVILAVALAFSRTWPWPIVWAAGCLGLQLLLYVLLQVRLRRVLDRGTAPGSATQRGPSLRTDPFDYSHSEVLHSGWWRSTTADALMIGRPAYGYLVWQRGSSPTLRELLIGARPPDPPLLVPTSPALAARLRRRIGRRWPGIQILAVPGLVGESPAGSGGEPEDADRNPGHELGDGLGQHAGHLDRPANVLALLHSGTVGQSLTFAVFRDQPKADWVAAPHVCPVDLDPDQLAPTETVTDTVEIFLGIARGGELFEVADHPVAAVLGAAAEHRLFVREVQLPVPTPSADCADQQWALVRIAIGDTDIERLAPFLGVIHQFAERAQSGHRRSPGHQGCVVAVKMTSEGGARIINPHPAVRRPPGQPVLASDIDVMAAAGPQPGESPDSDTWRVLAICADARSGVENEIVRGLGPGLRLAAMTYARLHGKAVLLVLCHQPGGPGAGPDDLADRLANLRADANLVVLLDKWQSVADLGTAGPESLLRLHIRARDRPGAILDVLDSLRETLQAEAQVALQPDNWNVWHARTMVTGGNAGSCRLTVRLSVEPEVVKAWGPTKIEDIERKVRMLAARRAAAADALASELGEQDGAPEDIVISVRLITVPTPPLGRE
jgi:hypothetical protein